jgi:hypothetical protein
MSEKFRLGLTMAGVVSAGAYTGGVLDYLIQTLDAWYAKKGFDPSVPNHEISLDIISDASAGGITGALALHMENRYPVLPQERQNGEYLKKNVFYQTWVNLLQDDMLPLLLRPSDIVRNGKVVSLLNSEFIEQVAEKAIVCLPECATAPPVYVSRDMELVLTLSNLAGFKYRLRFDKNAASSHTMTQHRDYAFFRRGDKYTGRGRIPLALQKNIGIDELKQAAPATGAFPVELAYRKFVRKKEYILENPDLVFYKEGVSELVGLDLKDLEEDYVNYNVDGGMMNNEPFDLTMKLMARKSAEANHGQTQLEKKEKHFDSTIIIFDPFPSEESKSVVAEKELSQKDLKTGSPAQSEFQKFPYDLIQVISRIYKAMRGELLFKGEDIVEAFTKEDFSRFLISPRRRKKVVVDGEKQEQEIDDSLAIACGALDGFAGFFDKSFREHDFYLGRANFKSFLRNYFRVRLENGVPVNPIFRDGYTPEAIQRFRFQDESERAEMGEEAPWYVPIIPDVYKEVYEETALQYPSYNLALFDRHREGILQRLNRIGASMIKTSSISGSLKCFSFSRRPNCTVRSEAWWRRTFAIGNWSGKALENVLPLENTLKLIIAFEKQ